MSNSSVVSSIKPRNGLEVVGHQVRLLEKIARMDAPNPILELHFGGGDRARMATTIIRGMPGKRTRSHFKNRLEKCL